MKKKILFILCTIVILTLGSIVNAATLKDVVNTKYEDSVNTLITLGLVNGYKEDDGTYTYKPNNVVTRAEMAKLMVVALGEEANVASAAKESPKFKDVKSSDWEYGYVNLASKLGIINGYPDGTFGSKNTVSYAEATAMMIRALEFEDEVSKSNAVWPDNYMNQAKKLSLYDSVGNVKSSEGAKRGNIAMLLWNMLRTGVCEPISQDSTGIIYGEGEIMLNKKMPNFIYMEDAIVYDVNFDDEYEEASIKIKGEKTITARIDALEAAEMYGLKLNVLYNTSKKEFEKIEEASGNNVKTGEVTNVTSKKIYIDGGNSKGYDLPKSSNILLYGIDDLRDAASANLIFNGSSLEYVVGFAPEKVYLALVLDNAVTVSSKDGIKVINYKASSSKSYKVYNKNNLPAIGDIILYYFNNDNELIVIESANVFESKEVSDISSSGIKLGNDTYKFSSKSYELVKVGSSNLSSMSYSNIDEGIDSVYIMDFGPSRYYIVFIGGIDKANEELEKDIDEAEVKISNYLSGSTITNLLKTETTYTQESYANFMNAYDAVKTALSTLKSSHNITNLNKANNAYESLQSKVTALKKITSLSSANIAAETDIVKVKLELRNIVNSSTAVNGKKVADCEKNSTTYTTASYTTFSNELKTARDVLKSTNATYAKVTSARDKLKAAMDGLVKKTDADAKSAALTELRASISKANAIVGKKNEYTESTYKNFKSRYDKAVEIEKSSKATADEITAANLDLINAMDILSANLDVVMEELNKYLLIAQVELAKVDVYMPDSYKDLNEAYKKANEVKLKANATYAELDDATKKLVAACDKDKLIKINDKLNSVKTKASKYVLQAIKDSGDKLVQTLSSGEKIYAMAELEKAMEKEDKDIATFTRSLNSKILDAESLSADDWETLGYIGEFNTMKSALDEAKALIKDSTKISSESLEKALNKLENTLKRNTTQN